MENNPSLHVVPLRMALNGIPHLGAVDKRETQFWDVFVEMLNNSILVTQYGKVTQYHKTNRIEKSNLLIEQRTFDHAVILS